MIAFTLPLGAAGQSAVSGQLRLVERPGARTTDLANAVVWLEGAGPARAVTPGGVARITMESRQFTPRVQVVATGSRVEYPNLDPFRHNVFSKSGPAEFDLGLYARGETRGAQMERPGVYPIFCNIHSRMVAYVVAVSSPWKAQPGSDGRFTFPDVPPGEYRLHAWHDRGGTTVHPLTVDAGGAAPVVLELDARRYAFVQHKNKFGQDYTTSGRDRY